MYHYKTKNKMENKKYYINEYHEIISNDLSECSHATSHKVMTEISKEEALHYLSIVGMKASIADYHKYWNNTDLERPKEFVPMPLKTHTTKDSFTWEQFFTAPDFPMNFSDGAIDKVIEYAERKYDNPIKK